MQLVFGVYLAIEQSYMQSKQIPTETTDVLGKVYLNIAVIQMYHSVNLTTVSIGLQNVHIQLSVEWCRLPYQR